MDGETREKKKVKLRVVIKTAIATVALTAL